MILNELHQSIETALEHYSNVHRGSGHLSVVSTRLYEEARKIVLHYLGLPEKQFTVIFCSPGRLPGLVGYIGPERCKTISGSETGLSLGVSAVAVKKQHLPKGVPWQSGGGTTTLYGANWVIWAGIPDRFEAGTPAVINVIAFAKALQMITKKGKGIFTGISVPQVSPTDLFRDEYSDLTGEPLLRKLKESRIGLRNLVPCAGGNSPAINFDNSASTPTFRPVWEVFRKTLHQPRSITDEIIRETRKIISSFLGAPADQYDIVFTSGTTESINMMASQMPPPAKGETPVILNTILEHSSNDLPWRYIPGYKVIKLPVDNEGFWDLKTLEETLQTYNGNVPGGEKIRLVTVSGASNVLGSCNDLAETGRLAHLHGALFMVDAAQLVAHRRIDMATSHIDCLALSAHKAYAPFGTGVLVTRKGILSPGFLASEQALAGERENAGGIAALGKALSLISGVGFGVIREEEERLVRRALDGLRNLPGMEIRGIKDPGSPVTDRKTGIILFGLKNRMNSTIAARLAWYGGIGVRFGCHCAHLIIKQLTGFTPFLEKFQRLVIKVFPSLKLQGFIRVSFGIGNSEEEVDTLVRVMGEIAENSPGTKLKSREINRRLEEFAEAVKDRVFERF